MAESLIFAVAESLISKLASRAVEQASLALGVYQELQQMKKTMALIKAFLLDAEQKKEKNNALSEWLRQIRLVFAHAEDIVDNFECEVLRKHVVRTHGSFSRKVCRLFSTSNPLVYRYRMGREINDIKKQLEKVAADGHMFGLQSSDKDTKDFDVSSSYVALLWEALGFLPPPKENETTHDVANEYLRELWSRSFLTDFLDMGSTCRFKLHDLVRELAVYVAKGEFQILYPHSTTISEHAQHLSFIENDMLGQDLVPMGLRTIIFPMEATNGAFLNTLVFRCKYLRVLDLSYSEYESLPSYIGKLKHLRYLSLSGNKKLKGLPDSVCKLQNLQTLDLRGCIQLQKLPKGIRKLISLRRLLVTTMQPDFPDKEISKLASIETLELYSCDNLESLFQAIQPRSLKFLHLSGCGGLRSLSFHVITNLESLVIFKCSKMELSMGLSNLNSIPDSRLKLLVLQSLPQLVTLPEWLQGSVNTLHSLLVVDCNNLEELPEWLSTLTCLKLLIIEHCPRLISLPETTHLLRNLEHLEINDCPELCRRCQPGVGLDWHKISHIKQVIIGEPEE
ncbi:disease resistance protein RPM1 [Vigna unguiculata]|uniref:Disease resistance protein RPM1 n=1 Tax=Vigna unguiculata TaxID=3917 RepID=A0A4D6MYP2_VIGUN|nr:disease resistance protein RPM1 [Vigna unguiculata]